LQELLMMPCPACGASLPIRPELDTVRCDFCSTQFATPSALRERAAAYLARIRAAWADEIEARWSFSMQQSAIKSQGLNSGEAASLLTGAAVATWRGASAGAPLQSRLGTAPAPTVTGAEISERSSQ
jgi:hypothetical protein